jgi:hypothetical protein
MSAFEEGVDMEEDEHVTPVSGGAGEQVLAKVWPSAGRWVAAFGCAAGLVLAVVAVSVLWSALASGSDFSFGWIVWLPIEVRRIFVSVLVLVGTLGAVVFALTGFEVLGLVGMLRLASREGKVFVGLRPHVWSWRFRELPVVAGGAVTVTQCREAKTGEYGFVRLKRNISVASGGVSIARQITTAFRGTDIAPLRAALEERGIHLIARLDEKTLRNSGRADEDYSG